MHKAQTEYRIGEYRIMSGLFINLIIQIVSGAIGGNAAAGAAKNIDLGTLGNTLAGAVGGGVGGQILGLLIPPRRRISAALSARWLVAASRVPFSRRSSAPSRTGRRRLDRSAIMNGAGHECVPRWSALTIMGALERDDFSSKRHPALSFCLSMISGPTLRVCPEGKPVPTPHQVRGRLFPDHALLTHAWFSAG